MTERRRRARRPEAKEDRRREIKDAARALLDKGTPLDAITMADALGRAGLSKGTGYLYFPTKEALFLEVLADELDAWFDALPGALDGAATAEALARALARSLLSRPRLLDLLAVLHAVLERNLDAGSAHAFKSFLCTRMTALDATLRPRFAGFAPGDVARLLLRTHALVVGLVGMTRPAPVVAEVLAEPALAPLRVDLAAELEGTLAALLRGWRPQVRPL